MQGLVLNLAQRDRNIVNVPKTLSRVTRDNLLIVFKKWMRKTVGNKGSSVCHVFVESDYIKAPAKAVLA